MKIQSYEFSKATRRDIAMVDFINDINNIINLGRYQMRVVSTVPTYTGEEGEHLFYVSGTNRRLYWYDITNSTWHYTEFNVTGLGQPTICAIVSLTGQTGDIGTTTIYTPLAVGTYRVNAYGLCTTAGAGLLDVTIGWTDDQQAQTTALIDDLNIAGAGNAQSNNIFIRSTAVAITYATAIAGKVGSPAYSLFITLERLT